MQVWAPGMTPAASVGCRACCGGKFCGGKVGGVHRMNASCLLAKIQGAELEELLKQPTDPLTHSHVLDSV